MAYPPHALLAWGGTMGNVEQWSCSLRMTSTLYQATTSSDRAAFCANALEQVYTKVRAYWSGKTNASTLAWMTWCKFNPIGADGKYENDATNVQYMTPTQYAKPSGAPAPFQIAIVATLDSGITRGLAKSGRIYIPCSNVSPGESGQVDNVTASQHASQVAELIRQLNNWTGPDFGLLPAVSVVSKGRVKNGAIVSEGIARPVTQVRVGRVLDTQRRRRAKIPEAYEKAVI